MTTTETQASATPDLHPYTVLLLRPDYMASEYGKDTYLAHVMARERRHAAELAQLAAFNADGGDPEEASEASPDYHVLLTLAGGHFEDAEWYQLPVPPLDLRQKATVLAAMRLWQWCGEFASSDIRAIATDGGNLRPLVAGEIDELCERINEAPAVPEAAPSFAKLVAVLTNAADLLDDAIDTHIYSDDDPPPGDDCPYKLTVEELRDTAQRLAACPDPIAALVAVIPYAESRWEDLDAARAAGNEDPNYPGAAEALGALELAKRAVAAHTEVHDTITNAGG